MLIISLKYILISYLFTAQIQFADVDLLYCIDSSVAR